MKRILLIGIFVAISTLSKAQFFQFGAVAYLHKQTGAIISSYYPGSNQGLIYYKTEVKENNGTFGGSIYYFQRLHIVNDDLSFGPQLGSVFMASFEAADEYVNQYGSYVGREGGSDLKLGFQVPLLAMARFGSTATSDSDMKFGGAIGAGMMMSGFNLPLEKGFMFSPVIAAEINIGNFGFRYELPFSKFRSYYRSDTGDIPRLTTSFHSFQINVGVHWDD